MKNKHIGQVFGKLTIIEELEGSKLLCSCSCGNTCVVSRMNIVRTKSCGCYGKEIWRTQFRTHGSSNTAFYQVYKSMKNRCDLPSVRNYAGYGGRGIKCLWSSLEEFRDDMYEDYSFHKESHPGRNTTIERIDNDGNYSKENCKWATYAEQNLNKRRGIDKHTTKVVKG